MPDAPVQEVARRRGGLAPIWLALGLAVIVIAALSVNTAQFYADIDRMNVTGVYLGGITEWSLLRRFLAGVWGQFWWLFGPFILIVLPGAVALYRMVRLDSSNPRR